MEEMDSTAVTDSPLTCDELACHGSCDNGKKAGTRRPFYSADFSRTGMSAPHKIPHYFLGAIASFAAFATRNFTTVFALIWIGSPVCGLRPMRALRCAFTRRPRPGTTNTPFFLVSLIAVSARCSRNVPAVLLLVPSFSAR